MNVNSVEDEYGNTLLHLASGGECFVDQSGTFRWGKPDLEPMQALIEAGAVLSV